MSYETVMLVRRVAGYLLIGAWLVYLASNRRWAKLAVGPRVALIPPHHSLSRFFKEASLLPLTTLVMAVAAAILSGFLINGILIVAVLIIPVPLFLLVVLGNIPFVRTSIRVHKIYEELARLERVPLEEVAEKRSLPQVNPGAPITNRLAWNDGSWMGFTLTYVRFSGRMGHKQAVVWSNVHAQKHGDEWDSARTWSRFSGSDELLAEAFARTEQDDRTGATDAVSLITLLGDKELTIIARPPKDLQEARNLLWFGRNFWGHVQDLTGVHA
jgi:hypothetical protein